jgi:tRNA(fMet)-specific endonuclease VapC
VANIAGLRYLLDTNILSVLIRQPRGPVAATLARRGYGKGSAPCPHDIPC